MGRIVWLFSLLAMLSGPIPCIHAAEPFLVFQPHGNAKGKNIVLISGDEEYRSEESLPQLAKILSTYHGFRCTVLFAIDPKDGTINPDQLDNIPGLEALDSADLMVILTRFRDLPDYQMKHIVDYVESGKPIVGMRTANARVFSSSPVQPTLDIAGIVLMAGSGALYLAKPGSRTTESMGNKARGVFSIREKSRILSSGESMTGSCGARRMYMKFVCRFQETARHWCLGRYSQAWTRRIPQWPAR